MKTRLSIVLGAVMLLVSLQTFSQHYIVPPLTNGNPGGLNQTDEFPLGAGLDASWTVLQGPSATPVWSPVNTIPFAFDFNGVSYNSYKVATSGVLTFHTGVGSVPGTTNSSLPSATIPNNSICVWGLDAPGTNDNIVVQTFGTAPNRQHWVFFSSYNYPSGGVNCWIYWSIVLEETTNNIYIVDQRQDANVGCTPSLTLGIQYSTNNALQVSGSPNITNTVGSDATPANNQYWTFAPGTQPQRDIALIEITMPEVTDTASAPYFVTGIVQNLGSATVTSYELSYAINLGTPVGPQVVIANIPPFGIDTFTLPIPWHPTGPGNYHIRVSVEGVNGSTDMNTSNNLLVFRMDVVTQITPRRVLLEEFTSSSSPPDIQGNLDLKALLDLNPGNHSLIKYQMSWPGNGDPYFTAEGEVRRNAYGANATPEMYVDGMNAIHPSSFTQVDLTQASSAPALMGISATHHICPDSQKVEVSVDVTGLGFFQNESLRLYVAIVEKTTFNNATTNGETVFYNVMKKMLPNANGALIQGVSTGQTVTYDFTYLFQGNYRLPTSANDPINHVIEHSVEEFGDLVAICWLADPTSLEVHNSAVSVGDTVCADPVSVHAGPDTVICSGQTVQLGSNPTATGGTPPYTYSWSPATGLSNSNMAQPLATPSVTTTYTLTVTDAIGNMGTDEVTITVLGASISSNIDACDSVATLFGQPGLFAYQWSTGETTQNIIVDTNGDYSYVGFHPTGCLVNSPIETIVLPVLPDPIITQSGNVLSSNSSGVHQWYLNGFAIPGANLPTYTILIAGNYTVSVVDNAMCMAISPVYFANLVVGCPTPTDMYTANITPTTARFVWTPASGAFKYFIRGRAVGNTNWTTLPVAGGSTFFKNVAGLGNNVQYEWQIQTQCDTFGSDLSPWSASIVFTTGCQTPDSTWTNTVTSNGAQLQWATVSGAHGYEIRGRRVGGGWATIMVGGATTGSKNVFGLLPSTTYEWTVRALCNAGGTLTSDFTALIQFTTNSGARLSGVQEFSEVDAIKAIPNPFTNVCKVQLPGSESRKFELYSSKGDLLRSWISSDSEVTIDRDQLQGGVYFLRVKGSVTQHVKLVVE